MPDDLAATLATIAEDIEATVAVYDLDGVGKNSYPISAAMSRHARVLRAALEAVLNLADEWGDSAPGIEYPYILSDLRGAITAELTGKEAGE